jgi:hypothetical protein
VLFNDALISRYIVLVCGKNQVYGGIAEITAMIEILEKCLLVTILNLMVKLIHHRLLYLAKFLFK